MRNKSAFQKWLERQNNPQDYLAINLLRRAFNAGKRAAYIPRRGKS